MKYKKETKQKAVKMALEGVHLKTIQVEIGPNPKAIERYIKKAHKDGICKFPTYKEVLDDLKKQGKAPKTLIQVSREKEEKRKEKPKQSFKGVNITPKTTKLE